MDKLYELKNLQTNENYGQCTEQTVKYSLDYN